jgi:hypothetical protein
VFPPAAIAALYECIGRCALRLKARANGGTHANGHEFVYRRPTWARRIARPRNFDGCDELSRPMKFAPSDHGRSGLFTQSARFEANRGGCACAASGRAAVVPPSGLVCERLPACLGDLQVGDFDHTFADNYAVASPSRTRSTICMTERPCANKIASVQPSRLAASSSSARRRSGLGTRLRCEMADGTRDMLP